MPVIAKSGKVIGGLFLGCQAADVFTEEHERLVVGIAGQVAIALDNCKLYEEVKVLNSKKDEFLSIASHELKTPLTSIKAFNQLMLRNKDPEKQAVFVEKSADHISRLEKLINDLLDVSRINAGKMEYNMETFNLGQMLKDSIESVRHIAAQHEIILQNEVDVDYTGDRLRLEQVVNNFLTNAIKYSPSGKKVIVNTQLTDENLIVSVQDFGIGISQEHLDKLFERYYRVDNTAMRFEGLGLGLFISSEILRRHRGDFWIESEPGKGSTFFFRLPYIADESSKQVVRTENVYKDHTITIKYDSDGNKLDASWKGFQNLESVKQGCLNILESLKKNNCDKLLNDNTNVLGTWSEAVEWVGQELFPMLERAGLKYLPGLSQPVPSANYPQKRPFI